MIVILTIVVLIIVMVINAIAKLVIYQQLLKNHIQMVRMNAIVLLATIHVATHAMIHALSINAIVDIQSLIIHIVINKI